MTWQALCRSGAEALAAAGIDDAVTEARLLLLGVFDMELSVYAERSTAEVSPDDAARYDAAVRERAGRRPLQYILRKADFYGRTFYVDERVLIPRFDTEVLIEAVLERARPGMRILEIGTGSGAPLCTVLLERPGIRAFGTDADPGALAVTQRNLSSFGLSAELLERDLFDGVPGVYDIIYSNPPYIPDGEIEKLMPEVADCEPRRALSGGSDGLALYPRIAKGAARHLAEGGWLLLEIGKGQEDAVSAYLAEEGFRELIRVRDLADIVRVVGGRYAGTQPSVHGEENV